MRVLSKHDRRESFHAEGTFQILFNEVFTQHQRPLHKPGAATRLLKHVPLSEESMATRGGCCTSGRAAGVVAWWKVAHVSRRAAGERGRRGGGSWSARARSVCARMRGQSSGRLSRAGPHHPSGNAHSQPRTPARSPTGLGTGHLSAAYVVVDSDERRGPDPRRRGWLSFTCSPATAEGDRSGQDGARGLQSEFS